MSLLGLFLSLLLSSASSSTIPRLKLNLMAEIQDRFLFHSTEEYTTSLREGSTVYVGGKEVLYQIELEEAPSSNKTIAVPVDNKSMTKCQKMNLGNCQNVIMVLQRFNRTHLLLCGTNAWNPKCWSLINGTLSEINNGRGYPIGRGVCPFSPKHGFTSLVEGEKLYSAAPLYENGNVNLRRFMKQSPSWLLSADKWMRDPSFVGMSPMGDHIFMFFWERNLAESLDIDPWISRVARVCKNDRGGSRFQLQNKWTTFLKARLLCNVPSKNMHFNRIQDVFVAQSGDRVYGIFQSNWNGSAICTYSVEDINNVFSTSMFKGFTESIPDPRPGTCGSNTQTLESNILRMVEHHPEMESPIHPIGKSPLIFRNKDHFKKIVVDSVVSFTGIMFYILFLAMGDGKIQKVLEIGQSVFIISELTILKEPGPISSMSLDSEAKLLYVTTAKEVVCIPLRQCEKYNESCESCVMARDPYCAWDVREKNCVPVTPHSSYLIQDPENGDHKKCPSERVAFYHSSQSTSQDLNNIFVLEGHGSVYLSCPKQSQHADYSWRTQNHTMACSSNEDECLFFISNLAEHGGSSYQCVSNERGHEQFHTSYLIKGSGSLMYLTRYSIAVYCVLMTAAALLLH
ncbi:semaphorin-7A-like [Hemiscyllium ocellatum]|uniref:semaphorin-7A-like n=1 Tax=Hemiscyllium ocellatum TaxID=170820 RepID=UPI0029674BDB|nr:semaphorin-7A-like [Hemiscyllium ocellatum]